jgi:heme a synthase
MSSAHALPASATLRPATRSQFLPRFAWLVLVYNVAVILWGAVVRATSSGAGCGDHWPLCNGVLVQSHPRISTLIELAHRATSGVTVLAVATLLIWTFRSTIRGHLARVAVVAATVFTLNEALLGALLVLLRLTADNRSPERAVYLSLHLANTLLLLGALALTAHFLSRKRGALRMQVHFMHLGLSIAGLAAIVIVGMTGTLAALGDTLYPAIALRTALAQEFSGQANWLIHLRILHPLSALLAGAFILWILGRTLADKADRKLAAGVFLLLGIQYALGVLDVALLAPLWVQISHLLCADLLWLVLVVLSARICIRPLESGFPI